MRSESEPGTQRYVFFCPGCSGYHFFRTPEWVLKGNEEAPTVTPSILTTFVKEEKEVKCHLYIVAGEIKYQADSWHAMRNQVVPMVEV